MSATSQTRDLRAYSVFRLYVTGLRMVGDFNESSAVEHYLELHPEAKREQVEAELKAEIKKHS